MEIFGLQEKNNKETNENTFMAKRENKEKCKNKEKY